MGHQFHRCLFFPRVVAVSPLCPRGLRSLDGECDWGESFILMVPSWSRGRVGFPVLPPSLAQPHRIGHADGCKQWDSFAGPAQPSPVPGASQGNGRMDAQVRTRAASLQLGPDPAQPMGSVPLFPSHCSFSLHPSWLIQSPSLAVPGTAEGTENPWRAGSRVCQGEGKGQQTPHRHTHTHPLIAFSSPPAAYGSLKLEMKA